jgi:hypothetical protein
LGVIRHFKQAYRKQLVQKAVCLMDAGKGVQLKIDILRAIHFIVSVTQSAILNYSVKCGHVKKSEEGSDVTEVVEVVRTMACKMKIGFSWEQALLA